MTPACLSLTIAFFVNVPRSRPISLTPNVHLAGHTIVLNLGTWDVMAILSAANVCLSTVLKNQGNIRNMLWGERLIL